jgi:histone-lysine N-methyltransferase SETMAR
VARLTEQKIRELGWEVLPHPPYSPDMAPTDYHLFRSLQHYLNGKEYEKEIKQDITLFIESKPPKFFKQGIENLVK